MSKKIAIIGAGISGANLASKLQNAGLDVTLFEKARGPGGRTSTRRFQDGGESYSIDHGAQYIDVSSSEFQKFIDQLEKERIVEKFTKLGDQKTYVAVPAMNSIAKYLAKDLNSKYCARVGYIKRKNGKNSLFDFKDELLGDFDLVISTAPPKQTAEVFRGFDEFSFLSEIEMKAHFAIMLISGKTDEFHFTEKHLEDSMLNWIGINSKKPQRGDTLAIIMHTNFKWSLENQDMDRDEITRLALEELEKQTGFKDDKPIYEACHRWLYGRTLEPLSKDFIYDEANQLACCGDYMLGDDIEAAYLSSSRLADTVIARST